MLSMEHRVYYGEYSLMHWINLMLKRNIILPKYQRSFVWKDKDVTRLITSLQSGQFVQPVTIANYTNGSKKENIILDGQQRLTSLLLTYLGYIPDRTKFENTDEIAIGDDSLENLEDDSMQNPIGWTFSMLLSDDNNLNTLNNIKNRIEADGRYTRLDIKLDKTIEDFLNNTYLGFSYIVPKENGSIEDTQYFFSTLFRNMNYLGAKLSPLESRRSLYFMGTGYNNFFEGRTKGDNDILCGINLLEDLQSRRIDFVRYLAILSQYIAKDKNINKVLVGYSAYSSRESYYVDYVSFIVGLEQENRIDKFDNFNPKQLFDNNIWQERFEKIKNYIDSTKGRMGLDDKKNAFKGWIDADYWLFGLLYWVLYEGKSVNYNEHLITSILTEINEKKKDIGYSKNPNRLGNLRSRIISSIRIYEGYVQ